MEQNGKTIGGSGIARATDVLRVLEVAPVDLSLAKIARRVELPRSAPSTCLLPYSFRRATE